MSTNVRTRPMRSTRYYGEEGAVAKCLAFYLQLQIYSAWYRVSIAVDFLDSSIAIEIVETQSQTAQTLASSPGSQVGESLGTKLLFFLYTVSFSKILAPPTS